MTKVLATGFGPFGRWSENPTQAAVVKLGALGDSEIITHVFQTSYAEVQRDLPALLEEVRPDCVLALGLAGDSETIRLEERAHNGSLSGVGDVAGAVHDGRIVAEGPEYLQSTLPLESLEELLEARGLVVSRSLDAGGYLCNFAFYLLQFHAARLDIQNTGFIHVPDAEHYQQIHGRPFDAFDVLGVLVEGVRDGSTSLR